MKGMVGDLMRASIQGAGVLTQAVMCECARSRASLVPWEGGVASQVDISPV